MNEVPIYINEPILSYAIHTKERTEIKAALKNLKSKEMLLPMIIHGKEVFTDTHKRISPPHEHAHILGHFCEGNGSHVSEAIAAALHAKNSWMSKTLAERAAVFLKAADLIATTYRAELNAATMLCQSKNVYQAEIDAACELIDFLRLNVSFANQIETIQPHSPHGVSNKMIYRPLEGFLFALLGQSDPTCRCGGFVPHYH